MIIGILGRKRHGKDTTADYLVANYGFTKYSLADPLKDSLKVLFDFNDEQLYGNQKEVVDTNWNVTPRRVMQFVGTELFRNNIGKLIPDVGDNFWLKCLENKITKNKHNIVIADLRFENEVKYIKKIGGVIWKVQRNVNTEEMDEYENNIDTIDYDILINNNNTINNLYSNIELAINPTLKNN